MKYIFLFAVFFIVLLQFNLDEDVKLFTPEVLEEKIVLPYKIHNESAYYCETDSDCVLQEYDFCCLQEWRYLKGCFQKGYESMQNMSCEQNEVCMKTGEPYGCLCENNRCRGEFDNSDRQIHVGSKVGWNT